MAESGKNGTVLLHISGPDRKGVTAALCETLSKNQAKLLDIGQTVIHNYLVLSALVEIPNGSNVLQLVLERVSELGLKLELGQLPQTMNPKTEPSAFPSSICVTLLGALSQKQALAKCTQFLADSNINIREIKALSARSLSGIEIIGDRPASEDLSQSGFRDIRAKLYALASQEGVDIALQRESVFRRHKRLICMDVDSTFVPGECIDILGELNGCGEEIAKVTERAMAGELDFEAALRERVKKLQGLELSLAQKKLEELTPSNETQNFLRALKALGLKVGVVSGGFGFYVDHLKERFQLDFAFANKLQVKGGKFTGELEGEIITPERKAEVLDHMSHAFDCPIQQSVAVGDGANDIPMLQKAGLGIAFHAKSKVQDHADTRFNCSQLEAILYLMGYKEREIKELL